MTNTLIFPILKLLSDGKFHSGETIARRFNVSRTSVWNVIQQAESLGIKIFSVRGRGYKLPHAVDLLDKHAVLQAIGEQRAWFNLQILDEVSSTNTYLMQQSAKGSAHVTCVAAHVQTQGKGRRGRIWHSQLGASLTFSLLWRFSCGAAALSGLSLAVGIALMRALQQVGVAGTQIKWPNDILFQHKKIAGILIELQGDMDGPSVAVIGIGINLKLSEDMLNRIDQPATDLTQIHSEHISQNLLLGVLLKHLAEVLNTFEQQGFVALKDEWTRYHAFQAQPVRMLMPNGCDVNGVVQGVADDGVLLVETPFGMQRFSAGEISLRQA